MAPVVTGTNSQTIKRGEKFTFTAAMLDYTDAHALILTTVPTKGDLKLNGSDLVENSEFTADDILAGRLEFYHDGRPAASATFGVMAKKVQQVGGVDTSELSSEATFTVTITAIDGWLAIFAPTGLPALMILCDRKYEADSLKAQWEKLHWGSATVLELATGHPVAEFLTPAEAPIQAEVSKSGFGLVYSAEVNALIKSLQDELNQPSNADLRGLIALHGENIELSFDIASQLTDSQRTRWEGIKSRIYTSRTRSVQTANWDWYGALSVVGATFSN